MKIWRTYQTKIIAPSRHNDKVLVTVQLVDLVINLHRPVSATGRELEFIDGWTYHVVHKHRIRHIVSRAHPRVGIVKDVAQLVPRSNARCEAVSYSRETMNPGEAGGITVSSKEFRETIRADEGCFIVECSSRRLYHIAIAQGTKQQRRNYRRGRHRMNCCQRVLNYSFCECL